MIQPSNLQGIRHGYRTPGSFQVTLIVDVDVHVFVRVGFIGKMVGAPWDRGPLNNQPPIYTLYSVGILLGISPFKGLQQGG